MANLLHEMACENDVLATFLWPPRDRLFRPTLGLLVPVVVVPKGIRVHEYDAALHA